MRLAKTIGLGVLMIAAQGSLAESAAQSEVSEYFAIINDYRISKQDFKAALREGARQRFYHGSAPAEELVEFEREVADELVNGYLLAEEAKSRGIEPDADQVAAELAKLDARNQANPQWESAREAVLATQRAKLENESRVERLEAEVRNLGELPLAEVRAYYDANPDKFTQPAANRLGVILLKVAPSARGHVWVAANEKATQLVAEIRGGADFAALAELHSEDFTAEQGGDMGFVHQGMTAGEVEALVSNLEVGEVTDPVGLLEGVAIFKLLERKPPALSPFEMVQGRATQLLLRERADLAWESLIFRLRQAADIDLNQALFSSSDSQP